MKRVDGFVEAILFPGGMRGSDWLTCVIHIASQTDRRRRSRPSERQATSGSNKIKRAGKSPQAATETGRAHRSLPSQAGKGNDQQRWTEGWAAYQTKAEKRSSNGDHARTTPRDLVPLQGRRRGQPARTPSKDARGVGARWDGARWEGAGRAQHATWAWASGEPS